MRAVVLRLIAWYQRRLSTGLRTRCVFEPSCSTYTAHAVARYGALRGLRKGLARVLRCRERPGLWSR